jgi:hypothetical protein
MDTVLLPVDSELTGYLHVEIEVHVAVNCEHEEGTGVQEPGGSAQSQDPGGVW